MKQCPVCKITYADDSIGFCLNDGTRLIEYSDEPPTQRISYSGGGERMRINIPNSDPTVVFPNQSQINYQPPPAQPRKSKALILGILLSLMSLFVISVFGYYWIFVRKTESIPPANINEPQTNANLKSSAPTPDETAELKEKLNKLEKQLAEQQKKQEKQTNTPKNSSTPAIEKHNLRTATVNSPNDGFLALRTEPNSKTGIQILKIPHGATVTVGNCANVARADGKTGKWCQVVYEGEAGWAFDGFLAY